MVATSQEYRVDLDIYNGPLDLLLYLIKREEIDIYDIPIARITGQYMQYMEVIKAMDLGVVGDFLVMAATLMEIKSRMLLPAQEDDEEGEDEDDPRMELVRQLIEYKRFKDAAAALSMWGKEQDRRFPRPGELEAFGVSEEPEDFEEEFELWHLVEAFAKLMQQTGMGVEGTVVYDDTPIHEYMRLILDLLEKHTIMSFFELFALHRGKSAMIGCFLALLELVKQRHVRVEQVREHGDIILAIRRPDIESTPGGIMREFVALPLKGTSRRVRLQRPMTTTAYQRRARRQIMAVPARRRAYRACIVSMTTTPALKVDVAASPAPPPAHQAAPPPPEMPRPLVSDDIAEVEVIDVRDVEFEAPDGWVAPPPFEPAKLPLRRPLARGAGRRLFVPRLPRGHRMDLPRRKSPLAAWPEAAPQLAEPAAPALPPVADADIAASVEALAAPVRHPHHPPAPALPPVVGADIAVSAEASAGPVRHLHHPPARGKGRKLFQPQYPRVRQLTPPSDVTPQPVRAVVEPVVQALPPALPPTITPPAIPVPRPEAPPARPAPAPDTGLVFRAHARSKGRKCYQPEPRAYRPQLPRVRHLAPPEVAEPTVSVAPTPGERPCSWLMAIWLAIRRFAARLWRYGCGLWTRWRRPQD